MTAYKLVIFDWDGTLMDSAAKIVSCMQLAASSANMPIPKVEEVEHIIGISLRPAIAQLFSLDLFNKNQADKADQIVAAYKSIYLEVDQTPCPLFEGVAELLSVLQSGKQKMAVATGKARRGLQRAWDNTGTEQYFVDSRCADEAKSKPSPDMLEQLLSAHSLDISEAIMVGDTAYDMQMAATLGMDRIAVTYGVHTINTLALQSPTHVVNTVEELKQLMLNSL